MQLAHYRRVLEHHGYAQDTYGGPCWAAIIGKEGVLVWRDLDDGPQAIYDTAFASQLAIIATAVARSTDPSLPAAAQAEWHAECPECPWRVVCHNELTTTDHITLLPGITQLRAIPYYNQGVTTIEGVATLDQRATHLVATGGDVSALYATALAAVAAGTPDTPVSALVDARSAAALPAAVAIGLTTAADLANLDPTTVAFSGSQVWNLPGTIDQARVSRAGVAHLTRGTKRITLSRTSVELDIDIEDADGIVYMIGVRTTTRRRQAGRLVTRSHARSFADWSHTQAGEATMFARFWAHLTESRATASRAGRALRAYHYTAHENSAFHRLATRHAGVPGVPTTSELDAFLDGPQWVDLHKVVSGGIVWPTENATLKTIAGFAGFSWRDTDPGGANSMAWYAAAVHDDDEAVQVTNRARLTAYNNDDCEAQMVVRNWLTGSDERAHPAPPLASVTVLDPQGT